MNTRMIVPAIMGVVILSAPALAAGTYDAPKTVAPAMQKAAAMTPAEKCTALEKQFDEAIKTHGKAKKAADAKYMRTEGGTLCADGKADEGAAKLETALKDLGVKPKS